MASSLNEIKRAYYASALGITEPALSGKSLSELEQAFFALTPGSGGDTNWTNFTMTAPYTAGGIAPAYRKTADGFVHLRGNVTTTNTLAAMFTLPAGYRPLTAGVQIPVFRYLAASGNAFNNFLIIVGAGTVTLAGSAPAVGDTIILDGVVFKAEQ